MNAWVRAAVDADLRNQSSEQQRGYLRTDTGVRHWVAELNRIKRDIDFQCSVRKADLDAFHSDCALDWKLRAQEYFARKVDFQKWRSTAMFKKKSVENALAEAKDLRFRYHTERKHGVARALLLEAKQYVPSSPETDRWHAAYNEWRRLDDDNGRPPATPGNA